MKNFLTPLKTAIGAKQLTAVVSLTATAFVVVQASSTSRNASAGIDQYTELANSTFNGNESFSRIAGSEPASKSPSASVTASYPSGVSEQAGAASPIVTFGAPESASADSAGNRLLPARTGLFASSRQITPRAAPVSSVGASANFSSSSQTSSLNGRSGRGAGSGGAVGGSNGSSAAGSKTSNTTRTDSLASSILEEAVASTALPNTDNSSSPAPIGNGGLDESSDNLASNPLDFSSELEDTTLDLMGMKIADLEPSAHSALSSEDDAITPVASVPESGGTLWLFSAAMVGLMAYGQRTSFRRHTTG